MDLQEQAALYEQTMQFRVEKDQWGNLMIATVKEGGISWAGAVEQLKRASND